MKLWNVKHIVIVLFLILVSASCTKAVIKPDLTLGPAELRWAKKTLSKMTVEEKIGQMVACRYSGNFVNRNSEYFKTSQP